MGHFVFTNHAVEQLISRYDRSLSHDDALLLLETSTDEKVVRLDERTHGGEHQWYVPGLGVVLVTKLRSQQHVVVTVISAANNDGAKDYDRQTQLEAYQDKKFEITVSFDVTRLDTTYTDDKLAVYLVDRVARLIKGLAKDLKHNNAMQLDNICVGKK